MKSTLKSPLPELALLALSLAVSQAYAADVIQTGPNGANGVAGSTTTVATDGANAPAQTLTLGPNGDASNTLTLIGGNGGKGGNGGPGMTNSALGSGGNGADANGSVSTVSSASSVVATAIVLGGSGGGPGYVTPDGDGNADFTPAGGNAGNGGSAQASSSAIGTGSSNVTSSAFATGGNGAPAGTFLLTAGAAGNASATAYGKSDTGNVTVSAGATGGSSDNGWVDSGGSSNHEGMGVAGASVLMDNAVSGSTAGVLTLSQSATGGNGGVTASAPPAEYFPRPDNAGGSATSRLTLSDAAASELHATVSATGGNGAFSSGALGGSAGDATAALTLASTHAGAPLVGTVTALGGAGGSGVRAGGAATATAKLTGTGAVTGSANATGGAGGSAQWAMAAGGSGGAATAGLTLQGGDMVYGTVEAHGGASGGSYYNIDQRGAADATLTITGGAGAIGTSTATGGAVTSTVNSITNGSQVVILGSAATGYLSALSSVTVQSGGPAYVRASADAYADENTGLGPSGAPATSNLTIKAHGDIEGYSRAFGGGGSAGFKGRDFVGGDATASGSGITTGSHAVMLTAIAQAGNQGTGENRWIRAGSATATAYGKSDYGEVNVMAYARGGNGDRDTIYGNMIGNGTASATAISAGVATARALANGKDVNASALAQGGYDRYAVTAGGADGNQASAYATSQYNASAVALPGMNGATYSVSNAVGTPFFSDRDMLLASAPTLSSQLGIIAGVGMQGAYSAEQWDASSIHQYTTTGDFLFTSTNAEHLMLGFISSTFLGSGFNTLDLSISANGTQLYSHTFTSLAEANAFFNDHVLDLGLFGAGRQDVLISSTFSFLDPAGYAFNYVVDGELGQNGGGGTSPVPEPASWLMMAVGMGSLLLVARRRKGGAQ